MKTFYACWQAAAAHEHRTKAERDECDNRLYYATQQLVDDLMEIVLEKGKSDKWRLAEVTAAQEANVKATAHNQQKVKE